MTKSRSKTDNAITAAIDRSPAKTRGQATMTEHDIARRAYGFYLARDCAHVHDMQDWLQAERELRARSATP